MAGRADIGPGFGPSMMDAGGDRKQGNILSVSLLGRRFSYHASKEYAYALDYSVNRCEE